MLADVNPQIWWYVTRSSGFVAWGLSIVAILLGMALSTRALGDNPRPAWLLDLHRFVGGLTVAMLAVHMGSLVADSYTYFSLGDLFIPYGATWKPGPVAWGVFAMWLLLAVEVSSLVMRRIPRRLWHGIHFTSYLVAVLSTVHAFTAGTDATNPALTWVSVGALSITVFFFVYRLLLPKRKRQAATAAAARARIAERKAGRGDAPSDASSDASSDTQPAPQR